jgi:hypothetical protein
MQVRENMNDPLPIVTTRARVEPNPDDLVAWWRALRVADGLPPQMTQAEHEEQRARYDEEFNLYRTRARCRKGQHTVPKTQICATHTRTCLVHCTPRHHRKEQP